MEFLSDRGGAFLSKLMMEVYKLLGTKKITTTAQQPQTDGLVERFDRTLLDMLNKTGDSNGRDWDTRLPFVLFAYRASLQRSTGELPFYLLYGRDPKLPTATMLGSVDEGVGIEGDDYVAELTRKMSEAWSHAMKNVEKAQAGQKRSHDRQARPAVFQEGDHVFVFMPAAQSGKGYKLSRPFHGPYYVVGVADNGLHRVVITDIRTLEIQGDK